MKKLLLMLCCAGILQAQEEPFKWKTATPEQKFAQIFKVFQEEPEVSLVIAQKMNAPGIKKGEHKAFIGLLKLSKQNPGKSLFELLEVVKKDPEGLSNFNDAVLWAARHKLNIPSTLSESLAQFDNRTYRILPISKDSQWNEYNYEISGAWITCAARWVATQYVLEKFMTPEQQQTPVFSCCNDYLRLSNAQLVSTGVEAAYAGYLYGPKTAAKTATCVVGTTISTNALDTFLERHAPQWLDYPDWIKRNVCLYTVAKVAVSWEKQRYIGALVQRVVSAGAAQVSRIPITLWSFGD